MSIGCVCLNLILGTVMKMMMNISILAEEQ
jgi:hypothetical protein